MQRRIGRVLGTAVLLLTGTACKSGSSAGPTPIPRLIGDIAGTFEYKVHFVQLAAAGNVEWTQTFSGDVIWEEADTTPLSRPGQDFKVAGGTVTVKTDVTLTSPLQVCTGGGETEEKGSLRGNLTVDFGSGAYTGKLTQAAVPVTYVLTCKGPGGGGSGKVPVGDTAMELNLKGAAEVDTILMHLRGTSPRSEPEPHTDVKGHWDFVVKFQ